jgi:hypothetical protein
MDSEVNFRMLMEEADLIEEHTLIQAPWFNGNDGSFALDSIRNSPLSNK